MREERNITENDVRDFINELQLNVGNKKEIKILLENHKLVIAYLKMIGVEDELLTRAAFVEFCKDEMLDILFNEDTIINTEGIIYQNYTFGVFDGNVVLKRDLRTGIDKKGFRRKLNSLDIEYFADIFDDNRYRSVINEDGIIIESSSLFMDMLTVKKRDEESDKVVIEFYNIGKDGKKKLSEKREKQDELGIGIGTLIGSDYIILSRRYPKYRKWAEEKGISLSGLSEKSFDIASRIESKGIFRTENVDVAKKAVLWQKRENLLGELFCKIREKKLETTFLDLIKSSSNVDEQKSVLGIEKRMDSITEYVLPSDTCIFDSAEDMKKYAYKVVDENEKKGEYGEGELSIEEKDFLASIEYLSLMDGQRNAIKMFPFVKKRIDNQEKQVKLIEKVFACLRDTNYKKIYDGFEGISW